MELRQIILSAKGINGEMYTVGVVYEDGQAKRWVQASAGRQATVEQDGETYDYRFTGMDGEMRETFGWTRRL